MLPPVQMSDLDGWLASTAIRKWLWPGVLWGDSSWVLASDHVLWQLFTAGLGDSFWAYLLRGVDRAWEVPPDNICCRHWHQLGPSSCFEDHFLMNYKTWVCMVDNTRLETKNGLSFLDFVSWWAMLCNSYTDREWTEGRISNVASFVRSWNEGGELMFAARQIYSPLSFCVFTTMTMTHCFWVVEFYRIPHFPVCAKLECMNKAAWSLCVSWHVIRGRGFTFWAVSPETPLRNI